jgi:hypothetical protein
MKAALPVMVAGSAACGAKATAELWEGQDQNLPEEVTVV